MKSQLITLLGMLMLCVCTAAQAAVTLPGPLVTPEWLHAHRDAVTIVDVRDWLPGFSVAPEYDVDKASGKRSLLHAGGHIEGARLLDNGKVRVSRAVKGKTIAKLVPERADVEKLMQQIGVDAGKPIVITSPGESFSDMDGTARVYWTLKYYGDDSIAILNGGNAAWLAAGYPVSLAAAKAAGGGDWQAGTPRRALIAEYDDVNKALADKTQLLDARSVQQYLGVSKKPAVLAAGHLRGARNFPVDVHTKTQGAAQVFLSADEYRNIYRKLNIQPADNSISYCNTGHLASGAWFVASEILGMKNVRLYDGSMLEWTTLQGPDVVGLAD